MAVCACIPDYFGDPYSECKPECTIDPECPFDRACDRLKCVDPCPGTCGLNAECRVVNHNPLCACLQGYTGDPLRQCNKVIPSKYLIKGLFVLLT